MKGFVRGSTKPLGLVTLIPLKAKSNNANPPTGISVFPKEYDNIQGTILKVRCCAVIELFDRWMWLV